MDAYAVLNEELTLLASSDSLPPYNQKLASSILYRLLMEESGEMSQICRSSILTVLAMLIREDVEKNNTQAIAATNQILERIKQ
ncbi:hypothetical protein ACFQDN_25465 [Pseudomonas asuensis]|jgi:hypothetical protein|uniref:Uncharacterized protein n=1 Tax=Pseudomonas asuensis TaxID=1825787 RepID=A0ABQ2GWQ9_9PSED|nr:hypothetical protein [Pseudomonas asuensis]GGM17601.1 hypothetical protein GCM10009425_30710 [Pseudomonas asuensis]